MVERGPAGQVWDASTDCVRFRFTDLIDDLHVHPCDSFRSGSFSNNERLGPRCCASGPQTLLT